MFFIVLIEQKNCTCVAIVAIHINYNNDKCIFYCVHQGIDVTSYFCGTTKLKDNVIALKGVLPKFRVGKY